MKLASLALLLYVSFKMTSGLAAVDPPNYNFSLDQLAAFSPRKTISAIDSQFKQEIIDSKSETQVLKYNISYLRYKFPVFVQAHNNVITDNFVRLPSYFLHDVFHQSLINRLGPQTLYKKEEESATYIWSNINGIKHIYHSTCTITCFPVYYAQIPIKKPNGAKDYKPLIQKMLDSAPGDQIMIPQEKQN